MPSTRSTSPPKSAWPGVSTMLMCVSSIADRAVLGEDRDAALALEVVAVHHPLADVLVLGERAGLHQQLVDERGLAVVDVGDDRDVAQVLGGVVMVGSGDVGRASAVRSDVRLAAKQSIIARSRRFAPEIF